MRAARTLAACFSVLAVAVWPGAVSAQPPSAGSSAGRYVEEPTQPVFEWLPTRLQDFSPIGALPVAGGNARAAPGPAVVSDGGPRATPRTNADGNLAGPWPSEVRVRQAVALEPPAPVFPPTPGTTAEDWQVAEGIPPGFTPWWEPHVLCPQRPSAARVHVDVPLLIVDALRHSARVRAISDHAIIAETGIVRAEARFDVHTFMESKFVRTSEPTGSTLDAGFNVPRLREEDWFYRAGLRQQNVLGGRVEMAQQIGLRDSNSQFFFPENQGNSRLTLNYEQPLLNGAGNAYNRSLILLASLDTEVAADRTAAELQDHLLDVIEAHWRLYEQRALVLQRRAYWERAEAIRLRLEKRRSVDSLASQVARARAAAAARWSMVIRAEGEVRNAESRLRALVNSPDLLAQRESELVPLRGPACDFFATDSHQAFLTALENRSEIDAATKEIEASRIRLNVAQSELLPVLDLVLETYVSGLRGDYSIGRSWSDQFSQGEPSYTAGLVFEVPLHRREAKANHQRREVELRQLANQFQATVETLRSEVEIAVREVATTWGELRARHLALVAAQSEADYLQRRWEALPGDDRAASFLLEELLDAQDRQAIGESAFVESQVAYTLSQARLNRAAGVLLKHEQVEIVRGCRGGTPSIQFESRQAPVEVLPTPPSAPYVHE